LPPDSGGNARSVAERIGAKRTLGRYSRMSRETFAEMPPAYRVAAVEETRGQIREIMGETDHETPLSIESTEWLKRMRRAACELEVYPEEFEPLDERFCRYLSTLPEDERKELQRRWTGFYRILERMPPEATGPGYFLRDVHEHGWAQIA
jgi:hypothetical protein